MNLICPSTCFTGSSPEFVGEKWPPWGSAPDPRGFGGIAGQMNGRRKRREIPGIPHGNGTRLRQRSTGRPPYCPSKPAMKSETQFLRLIRPCKTPGNPCLSLLSVQNPPTNSGEEASLLTRGVLGTIKARCRRRQRGSRAGQWDRPAPIHSFRSGMRCAGCARLGVTSAHVLWRTKSCLVQMLRQPLVGGRPYRTGSVPSESSLWSRG